MKATRVQANKQKIKISPRRALAEVRKPIPEPTRIEEGQRRYRRSRQWLAMREIVADEVGGC